MHDYLHVVINRHYSKLDMTRVTSVRRCVRNDLIVQCWHHVWNTALESTLGISQFLCLDYFLIHNRLKPFSHNAKVCHYIYLPKDIRPISDFRQKSCKAYIMVLMFQQIPLCRHPLVIKQLIKQWHRRQRTKIPWQSLTRRPRYWLHAPLLPYSSSPSSILPCL